MRFHRYFQSENREKNLNFKILEIYFRCSIGEPGALHDHCKASDDPHNHFLLKVHGFHRYLQSENHRKKTRNRDFQK